MLSVTQYQTEQTVFCAVFASGKRTYRATTTDSFSILLQSLAVRLFCVVVLQLFVRSDRFDYGK